MAHKSIPVWMKERMNEFQQAVRRPFNLERVARVTCDVGYLCANFSLPGPLCSRIGHDVRDRQTDVRHAWLLNAPYPNGGHNNESSKTSYHWYQKCVYPCGETTFFPLFAPYLRGIPLVVCSGSDHVETGYTGFPVYARPRIFDIVTCPWSSLSTKWHINLFLYEWKKQGMNSNKLGGDLLTSKELSESHVTWVTSG